MKTFFDWKGFEKAPEGCLLDQKIDLSAQMGFAYERSCGFFKDFHAHDRLMIVLPRGACTMEVRTQKPQRIFRVDQSSLLIVPAFFEHDDEGISSIYDTFALYPSEDFILSVAKDDGISQRKAKELLAQCKKLKRSAWFQQLVDRYFLEVIVTKTSNRTAKETLEYQIVRELLNLAATKESGSLVQSSDGIPSSLITENALIFIETNLFAQIDLSVVAQNSGTSVSSLIRKFKTDLKQTPYGYIKRRRLEEAKRLLELGSHSVGEVGMLVGYEDFGAFTDAFKSHFGSVPSQFLRRN